MKSSPDVLKVLVALAKNLRASAKNLREKEKDHNEYKHPNTYDMISQARAMHHALYNVFFIAKKAAGRKS